jgi:hypothetical protein
MTLTLTTTSTFVRAPEFVIEVIGYKPTATVRAHCVVCGWYGYETCHRSTAVAHAAHLTATHTCPSLPA